MSKEITVKIFNISYGSNEIVGKTNKGKVVVVDPCTGCCFPYSFFEIFNLNALIGKSYTFEGDFYNETDTFLAQSMYDPIDVAETRNA